MPKKRVFKDTKKRYFNPHEEYKNNLKNLENFSKPIYSNVEDYIKDYPIKDYPENEHLRRYFNKESRKNILLLPASSDGCLYPGGYYLAILHRYPKDIDSTDAGKHYIHIEDADDGEITKVCESKEQAEKMFNDLKLLASFYLYDLPSFGYDSWRN